VFMVVVLGLALFTRSVRQVDEELVVQLSR